MHLRNQIFRLRKKLGIIPMFIATHVLGHIFWKRGIVFLTRYHGSTTRIGEMAIQFDMYVKMGILGLGPSYRGILLARKENIVNPCLMKYWQRYIRLISNPILIVLLYPLSLFIQYNTAFIKMPDGNILSETHFFVTVQKQWEDEGRLPLLALSISHLERGWDCLEQLGVPGGAWFVCLNGRESGYMNEGNSPYAEQRNTDIITFLPAVKTIVEAGGWVIRMGDPSTKPLPPIDHVIDYAHSEFRSDWMDIFCCAECRFFLGTTSGLFLVASNFGVPCSLTNYIPFGGIPWSKNDIYIPKLYWSTTEKRFLTFKETLIPPIRLSENNDVFRSCSIEIVDNTPEEINDIVLEMLERLDGNLKYTKEDEYLQEKYKKLLPYNNGKGNSRIGRKFLCKYIELFTC